MRTFKFARRSSGAARVLDMSGRGNWLSSIASIAARALARRRTQRKSAPRSAVETRGKDPRRASSLSPRRAGDRLGANRKPETGAGLSSPVPIRSARHTLFAIAIRTLASSSVSTRCDAIGGARLCVLSANSPHTHCARRCALRISSTCIGPPHTKARLLAQPLARPKHT